MSVVAAEESVTVRLDTIKQALTRNVEHIESLNASDPARQQAASALMQNLAPRTGQWWTDASPYGSGFPGGALAIKLSGGWDSAQRLVSRLSDVRKESMVVTKSTATLTTREDGAPAVGAHSSDGQYEGGIFRRIREAGASYASYATPIGLATGPTSDPAVITAAAGGAAEGAREGAQTIIDAPGKVASKLDDWLPWIGLGLAGLAVLAVVIVVRK